MVTFTQPKLPLSRFAVLMISADTITAINGLAQEGRPFCFALNFEGDEAIVGTDEDWKRRGLLFQMGDFSNFDPAEIPLSPADWLPQPMPYETYWRAFDVVHAHLLAGNSYLVNLTCPTPVQTGMNLETIFHRSRAPYKMLWPGRFAVFSPETFVRIRDGVISTFPMKGTIDADLPDAASKILADRKELAEHVTIVDLLRNDLNRVARDVRVQRFRYLDRIETNRKNLLQVSSEISGRLPDDYRARLGNILAELLPAGSVSGAPKAKTLEIIQEAEGAPRGFYTGIMGRFDGRNVESAVMIRFVEQGPDGLVFRSGGGITVFSKPQDEYNELIDKVYVPIA